MGVLFASDLHIGHNLATELRGYDCVEDHDEHIFETLINQCDKRTVLYLLGDICMDIRMMPLFNEVPGRRILIIGNHDKFDTQVYLKYFERVYGFWKYKEFWLSHCPMHKQEMYGRYNLHGHLHKNANSPLLPLPWVNLNWDYWRRAVSLDEIRQMIEADEIKYG